MTWLTGTSTWGTLSYDLTRLITGETASSSNAATVASGDRWVREVTRSVTDGVTNSTTTFTSATAAFVATDVGSYVIATGIPAGTTISTVTNSTTVVLSAAATASASGLSAQICTDTIRTPSSKDVATGNCSGRTGYWLNVGSTNNNGATVSNAVARQVSPYTSTPAAASSGRWHSTLRVSVANTTPGNYSTASITEFTYDADSATAIVSGNVRTPNAAGLITLSNGATVSVTDPSGTLVLGAAWQRGFTSTYTYGVDQWPFLYRASGTPTFSVAPPGVAGTDYDIVTQSYTGNTNVNSCDRGGMLHGLGIKTATGLGSNNLYTASWNMALVKCRIFNSATSGVLSLDVGQSKKDNGATANFATFRNVSGYRCGSWAKAFSTAGSVTAASAVQYFMSVTADGIVLILNGDPGSTGKLCTSTIGAFTPIEPTYDVFPVAFNAYVADYTADNPTGSEFALGTQYMYWTLRRHQDGSEVSASRDWQTRWMRGDHLNFFGPPFFGGSSVSDVTAGTAAAAYGEAGGGATFVPRLTALGVNTGSSNLSYLPGSQNKPAPDGKWWLYGFQFAEGSWVNTTASTAVDENRFVRGQMSARFAFAPGPGWGSGDELTDTATGTRWLLVAPDYIGLGGRFRSTTNTYTGGMAVAEI